MTASQQCQSLLKLWPFQAEPMKSHVPRGLSWGRGIAVSWVVADPGCTQHREEVRQGGNRSLALCCLTRCPCCWPGAPSSYETNTYEPR